MKYADRIRETTTTTGTGTLNLGGAVSGFRSFVAGVGTGAVVYYLITSRDWPEWEIGVGTVTDATPDTLSRSRIIASSNSGRAVSFSAGTKDVRLVHPANVIDGASQLAPSVRVATTTSGTLSSSFENGDTVDGVTLATGDRILIKNQSTASENGIYVVAASGSPSRASDMFTGSSVSGTIVGVQAGTTNAGRLFVCTNAAGSDIVGTSSLTFTSPAAAATHASQHQHGGADEIATATPGANAIPKAGAGGTLASGWIPDLSGTYATASHNQASSTITDFAEAVDDRVAALLVAGSNVTLTYNDGAGTLTIASTGGGGGGGELTDTSIKTADYTAAAGERVLVDPSSATGDITITLPSTPGACEVMLVANAALMHNVRINRNGNTINGSTNVSRLAMQFEGQAITFRPGGTGYKARISNPPTVLNAYRFSNAGAYGISHNAALNPGSACSWDFWIQLEYDYGIVGNQYIWTNSNGSSNGTALAFGASNTLLFWDNSLWRAGPTLSATRWLHVVVAYGSSNVSTYVNGVLTTSGTASSSITASTDVKYFGARSNFSEALNGVNLWSFRQWNSKLSASNSLSLWGDGIPHISNPLGFNPVLWYRGQEASRSNLTDLVTGATPAMIVGGAGTIAAPRQLNI